MKNILSNAIIAIIVIALSVLGFIFAAPQLSGVQLETFWILLIICGSSALYCFVVGEISRNNSQMDKLWSILPIAYVWIIAGKGGMNVRLVVIAVLVTLWGIRLTFNFGRKGAYRLKFWEGEEDYRWSILRQKAPLNNKVGWAMFDLFFISIYQNVLVLAITLPALVCIGSDAPFGAFDYIAAAGSFLFLLLEFIADEQQWKFHQEKKRLLASGKTLDELEEPYRKGFNTTGLWGYMRHPNYLGEQGFWFVLYIFAIGAGATVYGIFNWTMIGPLFLIFLFLGSCAFGEGVSNGKYKEYRYYLAYVFRYFPIRKYNLEKAKKKLGE